MKLLIGNDTPTNSRTYTKQIHAYGSNVIAEILYQDPKTDRGQGLLNDLWYATNHKYFKPDNKWYEKSPDSPTEKQFQDAHKWADEQLDLLLKYGTVKVQRAEYLSEQSYSTY